MNLSKYVAVNTHYTRSVNLERDAHELGVISSYIPTSRALRTFSRVVETLQSTKQAPRAWSWIGPYGSGKSSASVFLGQLLSAPQSAGSNLAKEVLAKASSELSKTYQQTLKASNGCLKVYLTGSPEPISRRIVKSLLAASKQYFDQQLASSTHALSLLSGLAEQDKIKTSEILVAIKALQQELSVLKCAGIVIIIDEFGKFLEYEARHYGANDIYLLQALAEHACAGHQVNLMLFVLLHQSFEQYAKGLGESLKNEWSKVQGRFEEVPFLESAEQTLRVVAAAFEVNLPVAQKKLVVQQVKQVVHVLHKQQALPAAMSEAEAVELFSACYPLHPVSALLLPSLAQKIAQNERTLFSYLGSHEEYGLQHMLQQLSVGDWIYPQHIYDYFITNQSSALGDYLTHRRWVEVVSAVERLAAQSEVEVNLLKTIGILNIVGSKAGFKPSPAILQTCFQVKQWKLAIEQLTEQSLVTFRRYSGEYRVWQGSDFDLEDALQEELNNLGEFSLVKELNQAGVMQPVVARRYTIDNATLRYFIPVFIDAATYNKVEQKSTEPRILFYLVAGQDDEQFFYKQVQQYFSELDLVALCLIGPQLREAVNETQALRRVGDARQELHNDPIAKREYEDRLTSAEQAEETLILSLLEQPERSKWFYQKAQQFVPNKRHLQSVLSSVLSQVYHSAPIIRNELINRDRPSAQAVAARNKLLSAMLEQPHAVDLGIDKFPPEKAIYRALLRESGLHRELEQGKLGFASVSEKPDPVKLVPTWQKIEDFLASTAEQPRSFVELNKVLMAPPYGVKAGVLPILYITAYLVHRHQLALYEERLYRPELTQEMLDRFIKRPDEFYVQQFKITGVRSSIFAQYAQVIHGTSESKTLLELAQPLAVFMGQLPEYTQKTRRGLSETAQAVRSAFNLAKSPENLLFSDLPSALGFPAVLTTQDDRVLEGFANKLTEALRELKNAYQKLLNKQQGLLANAFNQASDLSLAQLRALIMQQCQGLERYTVDTQGLRAFLLRLTNNKIDDPEWLENILMFLSHKPSKKWSDQDQDAAEFRLTELTQRILDLEKLRLHQGHKDENGSQVELYLLRSVRQSGAMNDEVVAVEAEVAPLVDEIASRLLAGLETLASPDLRLAALAAAVDQFLTKHKQKAAKGEASHE